MSKFNKGDKVRVVKGVHAGLSGVVTDPWWQLSQSDWPCVEFLKENGTYTYADEDDMELAEDPYEYAVQGENLETGSSYTGPWMPRKSADGYLEETLTSPKWFGPSRTYEYGNFKIVKRRKAGPIEDA